MWWSGRRRVASERTEQLGAKASEGSRLVVGAVGARTRDRGVGSARERRRWDDEGDDDDGDGVARDETIR